MYATPRAQLHNRQKALSGHHYIFKHDRNYTQHVQISVGGNLQSNVAIYLIQLVNQLVDLLHDKGLALPHGAALVLLAGLCLRARFCLWGKGDGGAGARELMLLDGRCLLPLLSALLAALLLPLQRLQLELQSCRPKGENTVRLQVACAAGGRTS